VRLWPGFRLYLTKIFIVILSKVAARSLMLQKGGPRADIFEVSATIVGARHCRLLLLRSVSDGGKGVGKSKTTSRQPRPQII